MSEHTIVKCRDCGMVVLQCRCPGPHAEEESTCAAFGLRCKALAPAPTATEPPTFEARPDCPCEACKSVRATRPK